MQVKCDYWVIFNVTVSVLKLFYSYSHCGGRSTSTHLELLLIYTFFFWTKGYFACRPHPHHNKDPGFIFHPTTEGTLDRPKAPTSVRIDPEVSHIQRYLFSQCRRALLFWVQGCPNFFASGPHWRKMATVLQQNRLAKDCDLCGTNKRVYFRLYSSLHVRSSTKRHRNRIIV